MEQILQKLMQIANEMDAKGLSSQANSVDDIMKTALAIKTAQYVGVQGYWIRNTRCWGNCYRQKRASAPERPTQEIWAECHKEYTKSIDDESARNSWDKYAGTSEGLIKTADRQALDKAVLAKIDELASNGLLIGQASVAAINAGKEVNFNAPIAASSSLVKMAESLEKDNFELATQVGKAAQMLSKEAQWWNPGNWAGRSFMKGQDALRDFGQKAHQNEMARQQGKQDAAQKRLQQLNERGKNYNYPGSSPSVPSASPAAAPAPGSAGSSARPSVPSAAPTAPGANMPGSPNAGNAPTGDAASAIQMVSQALSLLHGAAKGDEKMFRKWFGDALKQSGVQIGKSTTPPPTSPGSNPLGPGYSKPNSSIVGDFGGANSAFTGQKPSFSGGKYTGNMGNAGSPSF